MLILGISCLYHDSAAALLEDGVVIAAAQEERFTRVKNDPGLPVNAIRYCLEYRGVALSELDLAVYYDNPMDTLDRFLNNVRAAGKDCRDLVDLQYEMLFQKRLWIHQLLENHFGKISKSGKLLVSGHHLSHAASAFFPSPFDKAAILTIDGVGEWNTTTIGYGVDNRIRLLKKIDYPHSLGMLYSAFTYFCGFKVNSGEYKLMGLAPYGEPVYYNRIMSHLIDVKEDGSFRLNLEYFDFQYGRAMTNDHFGSLFGGERREPETEITKMQMDMAASIQKVTEEIIFRLAKTAGDVTGEHENIVLAGGIALNCVANGKLLREKIFKNIWVQPAAGDAGGAVGAACLGYYHYFNQARTVCRENSMNYSYLGPEFRDREIEMYLKRIKAPYHKCADSQEAAGLAAQLIAGGKVIGLFQGRMEFGPRALGNRSIIADAQSEAMQSKLNQKIKFRESFRPFAPAVMEEHVGKYFQFDGKSPYMLLCAEVNEDLRVSHDLRQSLESGRFDMIPVVNQKRSCIPAVTHVDYSARIQTVSRETNPAFYEILERYYELTGCAVVVNTSFNVRGEPIVCSPEEAYRCFMRTGMDCLLLNHLILYKEEQPEYEETGDWRDVYELD